jgi:hypothetical protein
VNNYHEFGISDINTPVLACELVDKVPLSRLNGNYSTVSYCAGQPSNTAVLIVDGLPFMAFANLEHAIENALNSWNKRHPGEDLQLWVDQICINQHDMDERASQITMMRDIYRRCNETFISLSAPGMKNLLSWTRPPPAGISPEGNSSVTILENWARDQLDQFNPEQSTDDEFTCCRKDICSSRGIKENNMEAFLKCAWWQRSWVFQEFVSSLRPMFISYSTTVPWKELEALLQHLSSHDYISRVGEWVDDMKKTIAYSFEKRRCDIETTCKRIQAEEVKAMQEHARMMRQLESEAESELEQESIQRDKDLIAWEARKAESWLRINTILQKSESVQQLVDDYDKRLSRERDRLRIQFIEDQLDDVRAKASQLKDQMKEVNVLKPLSKWKMHRQLVILEHQRRIWQHCRQNKNPSWAYFTGYKSMRNLSRISRMPCSADMRLAQYSCDCWNQIINEISDIISKTSVDMQPPKQEYFQISTGCFTFYGYLSLEDEDWVRSRFGFSCKKSYNYGTINRYDQRQVVERAHDALFDGQYPGPVLPRRVSYKPAPEALRQKILLKAPGLKVLPEARSLKILQEAAITIGRIRKHETQLITRLTEWHDSFEKTILSLPSDSGVLSMLELKRKNKRWLDLKPLLEHSRHCNATDPRDRVYAFISLVPQSYNITPNYTWAHTVVHVLIDTAQKIVQREEHLGILRHVYCGRDNLGTFLPTWVPDWTSKAVADPLWMFISSLDDDTAVVSFDASKGLSMGEPVFRTSAHNETNMDLKVRGFIVDTLEDDLGSLVGYSSLHIWELTEADERATQAITTAKALLDDEIWVICGATLPVLLRPEGDDLYSFCGEVVLLDSNGNFSEVMTGQTAEDFHTSELQYREAWLA